MNTTKALMTINGVEILEDGSERFNLKTLQHASGFGGFSGKRPRYWVEAEQTKALVQELIQQGRNSSLDVVTPLHVQYGGGKPGTWAVEILAVDYAMWISPAFKIVVIEAFLNRKKNIDPFHAQEKPIMTTQIVPPTNPYSDLMNKVDTILEFGAKLNYSPEITLQEARRVVTEVTGWFAGEPQKVIDGPKRTFLFVTQIGKFLGGRSGQYINHCLRDLGLQSWSEITKTWVATEEGVGCSTPHSGQNSGCPYTCLKWEEKVLELLT